MDTEKVFLVEVIKPVYFHYLLNEVIWKDGFHPTWHSQMCLNELF